MSEGAVAGVKVVAQKPRVVGFKMYVRSASALLSESGCENWVGAEHGV